MITIVCVYKTGPKFHFQYVTKMYNRLRKVLSYDFKFVCLTDAQVSPDDFQVVPLEYNLEGWWSKIELFRPNLFEGERVLFFDLDTLFVSNIDKLVEVTKKDNFMMLRSFNPGMAKKDSPASGIMSFKPDCVQSRLIFDRFMENPKKSIENRVDKKGAGQEGDQGFIGEVLGWSNVTKFQDYLPKNYILSKRVVKRMNLKEKPPKTNIIAWSGEPTLDQLSDIWISDIW